MCGIRILLVEDDLVLNMATRESLEELGYEVNSVYSGPSAIAAIDRLEYITALLTDIDLGAGPDGFDVARHARTFYRDLPVVYVSGSMAAHHAAHGVNGSAFVAKPFQTRQVLDALAHVIHLKAA
jgi:CheY-like chemotaxis protein